MRAAEASHLKRQDMLPAFPPPTDKACSLEHLNVFRCASEAHREGFGEVTHGRVPLAQTRQERAARGVGEGGKNAVEIILFNHVVEYRGSELNSQPTG